MNINFVKKVCNLTGLHFRCLNIINVNVNKECVNVILIGNDEMFDTNEFYQIGITEDNRVLKLYFEVPEGCEDFSCINYEIAYKMKDITEEF